MWVQRQADGLVRIGASAFGLFLAGEILAFTAKPRGAEVALGRGLGTIECRKTVLAVHAPLGFTLREGNDDAEERPRLLNRDPYGAGWMVLGQPWAWETDAAGLLDAAAYRQHILTIDPDARFSEATPE
ncbi:MAG: hypothetical protein RIR00_951 [Pseudomonadota bacterium]